MSGMRVPGGVSRLQLRTWERLRAETPRYRGIAASRHRGIAASRPRTAAVLFAGRHLNRDSDRPGRLRPYGATAAFRPIVAPAAREGSDKRQAPAPFGQVVGVPHGRLARAASVGHRDKRHAVCWPDHLDREHSAHTGRRVRYGVGRQLGHAGQQRLSRRAADQGARHERARLRHPAGIPCKHPQTQVRTRPGTARQRKGCAHLDHPS
jgi:hypothetical protein